MRIPKRATRRERKEKRVLDASQRRRTSEEEVVVVEVEAVVRAEVERGLRSKQARGILAVVVWGRRGPDPSTIFDAKVGREGTVPLHTRFIVKTEVVFRLERDKAL